MPVISKATDASSRQRIISVHQPLPGLHIRTMSAASSNSPEAKELNLVGKVELRIALADSDAKLEAILKTYLPPLLLKLASEHVSVRNKACISSSVYMRNVSYLP